MEEPNKRALTDKPDKEETTHKAIKELEKRLVKRFNKAIHDYCLLKDGDKVLIALSGGKDSLFLLEMLARRSKIFSPRFSAEAVFVKMDNINYESDCTYLQQFSHQHGIPLHILETGFEPSADKRKTPCFLCSWYRRKAIFKLAQELGCNKIALGHHNDDIIHTAIMNLMYHGVLSSMPPILTFDKMPLAIIRPLCLIHEQDIVTYAQYAQYLKQIKLCPYEHISKRQTAANVLKVMERENPEVRYNIWHALQHSSPSTKE